MILGIIGGIGSGKSLATDYVSRKYGMTAIKTDDLAKAMMNTDPDLKRRISLAFGSSVYNGEEILDRQVFAALIHSNPELRRLSDSIVHPAVWNRVKQETGCGSCEGRSDFVIETAIPGTEFRSICTRIWYIYADKEIRIKRLMKTRGYTREYSESVIAGQIPEESYASFADCVLNNNTSAEDLFKEIDMLMKDRKLIQSIADMRNELSL